LRHAGPVNGLATSSAGSAVHFGLTTVSRASSFGGGSDVAEMACHHPAASGAQQSRRPSPPPHAVPDSFRGGRGGGAAPMEIDAAPPCSSSGSQPASPMASAGRPASDAEVRNLNVVCPFVDSLFNVVC
jgi:hypothetical protein